MRVFLKTISIFVFATLLIGGMIGCDEQGPNTPDESGTPEPIPEPIPPSPPTPAPPTDPSPDDGIINIYSFTDEVPNIMNAYKELNPDFDYTFQMNIIPTTDASYQPALDSALNAGGSNIPDIYCVESAFALKYTQGDYHHFATPYEDLGITVDVKLEEADIAQYTIDIGTNPNRELLGLGYQATGGALIYRRSIANDVWGTDDPAAIKNKIGPTWENFWEAAEDLKAKGYGIVSGDGDLWHVIEGSSEHGWIVDQKLHIDPDREAFLDMAKRLKDNDYSNNTMDWSDPWFADMRNAGEKQIFGFFGPAWLINYVMADNSGGSAPGEGTYGDWAVCEPPVGFFWGGTWILVNTFSEHKEALKPIIEWITLDSSNTGLQYYWANGTLDGLGGIKDTVASSTVMNKSNGTLDFLGGQNMFEIFVPAGEYATGTNKTPYDEVINMHWRDVTRAYTAGEKSRDEAIADFKQLVFDDLGIEATP